jgi:predicted acyltransferase
LIHYLTPKKVVIASVILLIGYWFLLLLFGDTSQPFSMLGNAGEYLDKFLMGNDHLYHGEGVAFDPEGLLSTMPAIVNVVIGYYAGRLIQKGGRGYDTLARLMLVGSLFIFISLCWNMVFPINKKLWTSSFVLLTTGLDLIILSALIYITEIKKWNRYKWPNFFIVFGRNPLFIYLLSELLVVPLFMIRTAPGENLYGKINTVFFQAFAPGAFGSLLFAVCFMLLCWGVGWWLYKRKIYIRV